MSRRIASVTWRGGLLDGEGVIESTGSKVLAGLPVTWASRSGELAGGKTSPEELIAAAHASCFSMALSHALAEAGSPPEKLSVKASVTFVPGTGITSSELELVGSVPGLGEQKFLAFAEEAKASCPVSQALAGVEISLEARLER